MRQPNQIDPILPRLVAGAGYGVTAGALAAAWDLRSVPTVGCIALMGVVLTVLLSGNFSKFRARGGGMQFEAERRAKKRPAKNQTATTRRTAPRPPSKSHPASD